MTSAPKTTKGDKGVLPNPLLLLVFALLAIAAIWFSFGSSGKANKNESATNSLPTVSVPDLFKEHLQDDEKVLAIGPQALATTIPGLKIVSSAKDPKLDALLGGSDVAAFEEAMELAGFSKLLIDPAVASRSPIPPSTVRTRLALGQPVHRLSAKLMSKNLFLYALGDPPPTLDDQSKQLLMKIARGSFAGELAELPASLPNSISRQIEATVILTVRPLSAAHISYHSTTSPSLAAAALQLGKRARQYFTSKPQLITKWGSLEQALVTALTLELEWVYDEGTFVGERDNIVAWRVIEPGIHGIRMAHGGQTRYLPPWYSVTNNYREVRSLFERVTEQLGFTKLTAWLDPNLSFDRFRTLHFRERTPGGPTEELFRAMPQAPKMTDVTRENLLASLKGLGDWIADNQTHPDGRYLYRYFPAKDEENSEYNMVRHCLGPFSMALTAEFINDPKYKEKADAGMRFIESHLRFGGPPRNGDGTFDESSSTWNGKPLPGPDVAILEYKEEPEGEWSTKMGGVAVAILGYTQYKKMGWTLGPERERVLNGLAKFLLYMQDEAKGDFHHYYVGSKSQFSGTRNSIYPGEILYALARLYGETKDERYRTAFKQSMATNLKWFKGELAKQLPDGTYEEEQRKNLVQFQPWIAMSMDEMHRHDPDPSYVEASNFVSLWIIDTFQFDETRAPYPDYLGGYMKVLDELPAMHTFVYTEGTAASFDLARRAGVEPKILERLRKGALLSARFILQQQIRPGQNDYFYPNPKKAQGGVQYCLNHNKQRIDYTYHALSSIYRILRAATPEDYAAAQAVAQVKQW